MRSDQCDPCALPVRPRVAPYRRDGGTEQRGVVSDEGLFYLEGKQERMLREPADRAKLDELLGEVRVHTDAKLKHNRKEYRRFVAKLASIGLLRFTTKPKERVGCFFVWKKGRKAIRMILDARKSNRWFKEPPPVKLCSSESLGGIEVELPEEAILDPALGRQMLEEYSLYLGVADIKDCFHRLRMPEWMSPYFCLDPIRARDVGLGGTELDGKTLAAEDVVYPCASSFPMGFSWSLFFAQGAGEKACQTAAEVQGKEPRRDCRGPAVFKANAEDDMEHYQYVDNLGLFGNKLASVLEARKQITDYLNEKGLETHEEELADHAADVLGCTVDLKAKRTTVSSGRYWRIRRAIEWALKRGRLSGCALEALVGHLTFCGLVRRPVLSVLFAVYRFVRRHYLEVVPLWASVVEELKAFVGLMPLMFGDWGRQWNDLVFATDASESGYGVASALWPREVVKATGRRPERSRYRWTGAERAREMPWQAPASRCARPPARGSRRSRRRTAPRAGRSTRASRRFQRSG